MDLQGADTDTAAAARLGARSLLSAHSGDQRKDVWEEALVQDSPRVLRRFQEALSSVRFQSLVDLRSGQRTLQGISYKDAGDSWIEDAALWTVFSYGREAAFQSTMNGAMEESSSRISFAAQIDSNVVGRVTEFLLAYVGTDRDPGDNSGVETFLNVMFGERCNDVRIDRGLLDEYVAKEICRAGKRGLRKAFDSLLDQAVYQGIFVITESARIEGGFESTFQDGRPGTVIPYSFEDARAVAVAISAGEPAGHIGTGDRAVTITPTDAPPVTPNEEVSPQ